MESIIFLIAFWGGIWLLSALISAVGKAIERKKENTRNEVAKEVLNNVNIEADIEKYKKKLRHIDYIRDDPMQQVYKYYNAKKIGKFAEFLGRCPECKSGYLCIRKGKYGKFIGCSGYPKCRFTKNIKTAQTEYKELVNKQIIGDIQKAYL